MGYAEEKKYAESSVLPSKVKAAPPKKGRKAEKTIEEILVMDIETNSWSVKPVQGKLKPPMRCYFASYLHGKQLVEKRYFLLLRII